MGLGHCNSECTGTSRHLPESREHHRLVRLRQGSASTSSIIGRGTGRERCDEHQCDRSHWLKERDECATRTSVTEGWPGIKILGSQCEGQLGKTSAVFKRVL